MSPAVRDAILALLARLEWSAEIPYLGSATETSPGCPICKGRDFQGHRIGCELEALVAALQAES